MNKKSKKKSNIIFGVFMKRAISLIFILSFFILISCADKEEVSLGECKPKCSEDRYCNNGKCEMLSTKKCIPECPEGKGCRKGICEELEIIECSPNCASNEICNNGLCENIANNECIPECSSEELCNNGLCEKIENNECTPECSNNQICNNGVCQDTGNNLSLLEKLASFCTKSRACCVEDESCTIVIPIDTCVKNLYNSITLSNDSFKKAYTYPINHTELATEVINCSLSANTCDELKHCNKAVISTTNCDPNTFTSSCDGDVLKQCNNNKVVELDCSKRGLSCAATYFDEDSPPIYSCKYLSSDIYCTDGGGEDTYESTCVDNKTRKYCFEHRLIERDCEYELGEGSTCIIKEYQGSNYSKCETNIKDEACDEEDYEVVCDGQYIKYCAQSNYVQKLDCKKIAGENFSCFIDENYSSLHEYLGYYYDLCVNTDLQNKCNEETPTCNGNTLSYCLNGQTKSYDCVENGYSSCDTFKNRKNLDEGYCKL